MPKTIFICSFFSDELAVLFGNSSVEGYLGEADLSYEEYMEIMTEMEASLDDSQEEHQKQQADLFSQEYEEELQVLLFLCIHLSQLPAHPCV